MAREFIYHGHRIKAPWNPLHRYKVITWEDPGGLDLEDVGDYSSRDEPRLINGVVLHWGTRTPESTDDVLEKRGLSTHLIIEGDTVYQVVDLGHAAWHAKGGNEATIGIDIAESAQVKDLQRQLDEGDTVHIIKNVSGRGDEEALSLDPVTARTVRAVLSDLSKMFGFCYDVPRNPDGSFFYGLLSDEDRLARGMIFGHFQLSAGKWDPAPWWEQLFWPIRYRWPRKAAAIGIGLGVAYATIRLINRKRVRRGTPRS